jgi:hypothetical protein
MPILKYQRAGVIDSPRSGSDAARRLLALALRRASAALARLSRRLAHADERASPSAPQLEFYSGAEARDGALYVDGKLIGWVSGVRRL